MSLLAALILWHAMSRRTAAWFVPIVLCAGVGYALTWRRSPPAKTPDVDVGDSLTSPAPSTASDPGLVPEEVEPAPAVRPGEPLLVELTEEPAERYGAQAQNESDRAYAATIEALGRPEVIYDAALGHAARELAYEHSLLGGLVPQDIVDFLVHSAGAIDRSVTQGYTATGGEGMEAVSERLLQMLGPPPGSGTVRVGVGEAFVPGAQRPRYIAVLLSRREVEISSVPRRVPPGTLWVLSGILPPGYESPTALVLRGERIEEVPVTSQGRRFTVDVAVGERPATLAVSVGATGPFGPTPLLQLPIEVGRPLPSTFETRVAEDESAIRTPDAGEALALGLLDADRRRYHLPDLVRDEALDAIARAHSVDMRDHGFFGHVSPDTGGPSDRLAAAGYRASTYAENVASGGSLHGAEAGLFASLGHRRNILNPDVTHVGIGVAGKAGEDGRIEWHLTQLFARPVVAIDASAEAETLRAALDARRHAAGIAALAADQSLDAIARQTARLAAQGGTEGLADRVIDQARRAGETRGGAYAFVQSTTDVGALALPDEALDPKFTRVGLGVVQLDDHPQGIVGVVVLLTGDRS